MYIVYYLGTLIILFVVVGLIKLQKTDEEELPVDIEQLIQILKILFTIGAIFIAVSTPFINYVEEKERRIFQNNQLKIIQN